MKHVIKMPLIDENFIEKVPPRQCWGTFIPSLNIQLPEINEKVFIKPRRSSQEIFN